MKRASRWLWGVLLGLMAVSLFLPPALLPASFASVEPARTLRVGVYQDHPLAFVDKNGQVQGFYIDILEEIARQEGWHLVYVAGTWEECLRRLEAGEIDLLVAIAYRPERTERYDFNQETVLTNWGQVYTVPGGGVNSILDLRGKVIAGLPQDIYTIEFSRMLESFDIPVQWQYVDEYRQVLEAVSERKVDAGIVARLDGWTHEKEYSVVRSNIICCPTELRFAATKGKHRDVLDAIDRRLSAMKADRSSVYYRSMARWIAGAEGPAFPRWVVWLLVGLGGAAALAGGFNLLLRAQLQARTRALREEIERRRLGERVQQAAFRISEAVHTTGSLEEFFALVQAELKALVPADNFFVALYDAARDQVSLAYFSDVQTPRVPMPAGKTLTAKVIRENRAVLLRSADIERLIAAGETQVIGPAPKVWVGIPLRGEAGVLGAMVLQDYHDEFAICDTDLPMLTYVAEQVALAIERKRMAEALRQSEARFRRIAEQSLDAIFVLDREERFQYVSPAFERITGYNTTTIIGQPWWSCIAEDSRPAAQDGMIQVWSGKPVEGLQVKLLCRDGKERDAEINIAPVVEDGRVVEAEGIMRDITDRKQLEAQFLRAQKMEAVGRLAGGIAHDFNNLLTAIIGNAELGLMQLHEGMPGYRELQVILQSSLRAAKLTRQLLMVSKRDIALPQAVSLNDLILSLQPMYERLLGEDIHFEVQLDPLLHPVMADQSQLEQVLLNLLVNARDAMPQGGRVYLSTANVYLDEEYCRRNPDARPGDYVLLAITDTGIGMTPEVLEHVFEPFFTTKPNGTGLGLSTVYGIVHQYGGIINVYSEVGRGTTFKIYLPALVRERPAAPQENGDVDLQELAGTETILLVEDEPEIRQLAQGALRRLGYHVVTAESAEEALEVAARLEHPMDLLISDVVLPGKSGPWLARELMGRHAGLRVLFISGYADDRLAAEEVAAGQAAFLSKPFTTAQLARQVRAVLDGRLP
jgi:PAS domain S-box-containing protein